MKLGSLISGSSYESREERCVGCDNRCNVRIFRFKNGEEYASGNNCEKVYSSHSVVGRRGVNMFEEKFRRLFKSDKGLWLSACDGKLRDDVRRVVCIPRGLGIYEDLPFWRGLFESCGIEVLLSRVSTNTLYESGIRTIMSDNICYPAKLMHGHVMDLVGKISRMRELEVKSLDARIFYPYVVYERKEDSGSGNSYNCPIVSGYSDVLRSSIDTEGRYGIRFDSPVMSFNDEGLLLSACVEYLGSWGISKSVACRAVEIGLGCQRDYIEWLRSRNEELWESAQVSGRFAILLAGRPYHTDPLIEHKVSSMIADLGIDVLTEHVALDRGSEVYSELNALSQWAYPNRVFKSAYMVGKYGGGMIEMVELTSFGCGPDAFILDEVQGILGRYGKVLTILKIDDVNNIGSLRLRVRSLVESIRMRVSVSGREVRGFETTRVFESSDRDFTIIAPYFAEGYSELLPSLFGLAGYRVDVLPMGSQSDAEMGLRYANNDICYPATIVVGSIMNALQSGRYDLSRTAVIITQTGGQCRASNYYSLIKNALVAGGYSQVPLLSLSTGTGLNNVQPGFEIRWGKIWRVLLHAMCFADGLNRLYYSASARELEVGSALRLRTEYIRRCCDLVSRRDIGGIERLMSEAAQAFEGIIDRDRRVGVIGLVGEIYVKYNSFSHKDVVNWLLSNGIEVVPPSLIEFFSTSFVSRHVNRELHIKREGGSLWLSDVIYRYIRRIVKRYDARCRGYSYYRCSSDIFEIASLSKRVISSAADFGEGWLLPGEICHLVESGVRDILSLQPFGCIANHVISKGIERKIRSIYKDVNLLFLDFDSSTSDANVYNRLHFLVDGAKKRIGL